MSIKQSLLRNFFNKHSSPLKTPSDSLQVQTPDPKSIPRSQSSVSLNCKSNKVHSRPISSCRELTPNKSNSSILDPVLPSNLLNAIKKLNIKTILDYNAVSLDENMTWLLYSFLILLSLVDKQGPASSVVNLRSKVYGVFKQYLKSPGVLIQQVRKIPNFLQSNDLPLGFLTKLQASFQLVKITKLNNCLELYEIVLETLAFLKSSPKIHSLSETYTKIKPVKSSQLSLSSSKRSSSTLNLIKKKETCSNSKPNQAVTMKTSMKPQVPKLTEKGKKDLRNNDKIEQFLFDSRVNKRIHEKIGKFLKDKEEMTANGMREEEIGQKLLDEFTLTLPVAEISSSSVKFLQFFRKGKEFEKVVKKIVSRC